MNNYEFAVLYHPDLEVDLSKAEGKLTKIITDNGGKIKKTDNWGKRKLAYSIKGHDYAVYVFYIVELPSASVQKIETTLTITDEIIRFLITRPDVKAMEKAEAVKSKRKGREEEQESSTVEKTEEE